MIREEIKYIQIFVLCILMQTTYAQQSQTMLQKENLKGAVKSVHVTNGYNQYVKVWFDMTGKIARKEVKSGEDVIILCDYLYDKKDRLLSANVYSRDNPTDTTEIVCKYRNDGMVEFDGRTCKYDERGNCIWVIRQRGHDNEYLEHVYNDKNQLIEAFTHNGSDRLNVWKTDSLGMSYEETQWTEPTKREHVFFEYNEFNDVSLVTLKTRNGYTLLNTVGAVTYKGYDRAGNWLEQILPEDNSIDSPLHICQRYYEIYDTFLSGFHIKRIIEYYE